MHTVAVLHSLDDKLAYLSPSHAETDPTATRCAEPPPLTRGPLTGVWGAWDQASSEQIHAFSSLLQHSTFDLLRM